MVTLGMLSTLGGDTWHAMSVRYTCSKVTTGMLCQMVTLGMVYMLGDETWHGIHGR
jgi:hypothetical protein